MDTRARWAVPAVAMTAVLALTGCGAPGPSLETVAAEPVFTAPVPAQELGRAEQEPSNGFPVGIEIFAVLEVAYAVDLSPDEAIAAWERAYDSRYGFEDADFREHEIGGRSGDVAVSVEASDRVEAERDELFTDPPPGLTVVTITGAGQP